MTTPLSPQDRLAQIEQEIDHAKADLFISHLVSGPVLNSATLRQMEKIEKLESERDSLIEQQGRGR